MGEQAHGKKGRNQKRRPNAAALADFLVEKIGCLHRLRWERPAGVEKACHMRSQARGEIGEGNIWLDVRRHGSFGGLRWVCLLEKPFLHVRICDKPDELLNAFRL
ncbi:hypothetical protein [Rhizobium sp. SL42]|uniref:hypothetical protein n=1 Tax=Rhizobium sp. SL42 TaxID=2806346 RepID=UPI001F242E1F|nr:hypothetical protein [Rhizobium sp. SL42]